MSKLPRILILLGLTGLFATSQVQRSGLARLAPVLGNPGSAIGSVDELKQYTAGGHVLGFRKGEMFVASGDHALRVEFVNARPVSPGEEAKSGAPESSRPTAQPLGKVSYPNLWDGVTLVYENHGGGVVKSTYRIEPVGNRVSSPLNRIRLHYNVPVKVDDSGSLVFSFPTGEMRESRPVAWQEIEGNRVPVEVIYRLKGDQEVGFKAGPYDPRCPLVIDPVLSWNTFLGGSSDDQGNAIAVDTSGNVYVTGSSDATWGSPVRPFAGGFSDAFVAKLNKIGALQWNTFLGGSSLDFGQGLDYGQGIAVDTSGNVYVTGYSNTTWGSPLHPLSGSDYDAFVAKLNGSGVQQWNTFLGGSSDDRGLGIAVDTSRNVYVTGWSWATWGSPARPYAANTDAFVAKLNGSGALQWSTFLGGSDYDYGEAIALDTSGNVYVTGESDATWGSPVRPYSAGADAFVAKLNGSDALQWNTFLGGSSSDFGSAIALDTSGNVYVAGSSLATWGSPVRGFSGSGYYDAFAAKLNYNGALQWNTFLGGSSDDRGYGIALDTSFNVYVTGWSSDTWGSPARPYATYFDAFVVKLNYWSGALQWNTFLGGSVGDYGYGIAVDMSRNVYVTGQSWATWGSPVRPFAGYCDAFVAKISDSASSATITVTSPYGGESWAAGSSHNITWTSTGTIANVKIEYSTDSGSSYTTVIASTTNTGSYGWTVPNTPSTTCLVQVSDASNAAVNDVSDAVFSIVVPAPTVTVTSPDGGESWAAGSSHNVTWTTTGTIANVKVECSTNSGSSYATVIASTANNGSYHWTIPNTPSTTCLVRASDASNGAFNDVSNAVFTIVASSSSKKVDFNGDGHEDILWRNYGTGQNAVWFLGGYTATGAALADSISQDLMALNMNQDRAPNAYRDIAEVGGSLGKPVETMFFDPQEASAFNMKHGSGDIYLIQAQMSASGGPQYLTPAVGPRKQTQNVLSYVYLPAVTDLNWKIMGTGDFNGDGKIDILWQNYSTGQNAVWFMNGVSNTGSTYLPSVTDLNWRIVGTGDFNGDGQIDILWRNNVTGQNAVWFMNGATYISYAYLPAVTDMNWQIVGTGDLNGDGQIDILWRNYLTGQNAAWGMNGTTETSSAYLPPVTDTNWRIMGTGDFNGDGKVDIIWRNSLNGQNVLWYMNGITYAGYDFLPTVADSLWRIANR